MTFKERFRLWLIRRPGKVLIWLWMKSCRWTVTGEGPIRELRRAGRPVVLLVWHGKIFVVPYFFRRRGIMPLVSPSQDGELVATLMDGWGYKILRGSGSHPMKTAWLEMKKELTAGGEVIIVPDGPKGPDRKFKLGGIKLATETGAVLVPFSFTARRKKVLRSWDRFVMFYPFARVTAAYGEPVEIRPGLTGEELESERLRLESLFNAFDASVDRTFP
jgi:hypothetical protein